MEERRGAEEGEDEHEQREEDEQGCYGASASRLGHSP
jgi:hypothetical protein